MNLDRRQDRWSQFIKRLPESLPFPMPRRFSAIDGKKCPPPDWWKQGGGAWGCYRSHLSIIEECLLEGIERVLLLEDDALLCDDFNRRFHAFIDRVPPNWEMLYLGGQHLGMRAHPPLRVNDMVYRPWNVNRTHAFALRGAGLRKIYKWLNATNEWRNRHHIDHHLGRLHQRRNMPIYCPKQWLIAQGENLSNIAGKKFPTRFWNARLGNKPDLAALPASSQLAGFVAVIGLHRSGSSCVATILHKLGVHMGNKLGGYEKSGGGEAAGLAAICEAAAKFPSRAIKTAPLLLDERLRKWIGDRRREAAAKGTMAGGKYPHLCAMLPELTAICGSNLKVIHCDRPLEDSVASLCRRSAEAGKGWLHVSDADSRAVQQWLQAEKTKWLPRMDHLTVAYRDLLAAPAVQVSRIVEYLGLSVTQEQIEAAIAHVDPAQCHIHATTDEERSPYVTASAG